MNHGDPTPGIIGFALMGGAVWLVWRIFRKPRYIVDERGERQRIITWSRGEPVFDPKTWQQRVQEEALLRRQRRWHLLICTPFFFGPLILYANAVQDNSTAGGFGAGILVVAITLPLAFYYVPLLFREILYQFGYQGMQGAKVRDRKPPPGPGREVVETQKAHGDAQIASEAEAVALLSKR